MASRWAVSAEDAAAAEQRKQEKLEKKRVKEEQARQAAAKAAKEAAYLEQQAAEEQSRPAKRRKLSPSPPPEPEAHLLTFPTYGFGPSASIDEFELLNAIEEGSYGKVSRARTRKSGDIVALKKLKINHTSDEGFPITGLREIQTLNACSHLHIISLREVVTGPSLSE